MLPSSQLREVTFKDYVVILRRRLWIILACFTIISVWSTIKALKKIPIYQTAAKVVVERNTPNISPIQQVYSSLNPMVDRDYIQSQIAVLKSRSLAKKVVEYLIISGDTTFSKMKEPEGAFLGGVSINLQPSGNILNIGYISTDPVRAAKLANSLTDVYIKQDVEKKMEVTQLATGWLEIQLATLREKLENAERGLNKYIEDNEIVSAPDLESNTQNLLDRLKQEKINLEGELTELSNRYRSKHPKIVSINTKLETVNKNITEEYDKLMKLNQKMVQYNALKREVQSNKSLYEALLKRTKETEIVKELETTNIRVIDWAEIPRAPFSPNRKRDITTGMFMGMLCGLGLAVILEYLDSTVKTADEIEMYIRLPFLGYIPSSGREVKSNKDTDLVSYALPHSRIAEAYRSVRTSIIFSAPEDRPLKTILVTSASPQEGKTTICINLGIVFAQANEKTLLIEADMRKPRIGKSFNLNDKPGLSSFLTGSSSIEEIIQPSPIPNLSIILAGPRPPNPAELLTSRKPQLLLEELKVRFDRIILDCPPVITVTDTAILANIADGVIDVIRANFLNIELILRGRQRLYEAKARIIGVILNNVDVKKEDSYYYYHYYYSYGDKKENS